MRKKYTAVLLGIVLCLSIILSACTDTGINKPDSKTEDIKTVEAGKIERETPPAAEEKQESAADDKEAEEQAAEESTEEVTEEAAEQTDKETTGESTEETADETATEKNTANTESQEAGKTTGTSKQQPPAQPKTIQQNTTQNTTQHNTAQKSSTNTTASANTGSKTTSIGSMRQKMLELVNAERKKAGLKSLTLDTKLTEVAALKAEDMVKNNYFSHTSSTYGDPFAMMEKFGLEYMAAGENLAGNSTVEAAHKSLMSSPGHRANILNSEFIRIGIGIKESPKYGYVFVQMFASETVDDYMKKLTENTGANQPTRQQNATNQPAQQQNPVQENASPMPTAPKPLSIEEMRTKMLELINAERKKAGVKSLTLNSDLTKIAQIKAEDMVKNNYFAHTSPTYGSPSEMVEKLGYITTGVSENICLASSLESAHEALMNSPGHRRNILSTNSSLIGIGIQKRSDGSYIFVQMFSENIYNPDLLFERTIKNTITRWCSKNSVPVLKQTSRLNSLAMEYFNAITEGKDARAVDSSKYTSSLAGVLFHSFTSFNPGTDLLEKEIIELLDSQKDALPSSFGFVICSKIIEKTETFTRYANYVVIVIEGQAVKEGQEIPFHFTF